MSWKRLFISIPLGFLIMIVDGLVLIVVNLIYRPNHPPGWVTGVFFHFDAWPVSLTRKIFPGPQGGTTLPAVASGALINLIVLTAIVYVLLSWRSRRKARG